VRQLPFEIPLSQSVAPLYTGQDLEARQRSRHALALNPRQQSLVIERLAQANDGAVELPVALAEPAHVINERIVKARRIIGRLKQWLREWTNWFRLWSPLH
jgi:hypothetical protein